MQRRLIADSLGIESVFLRTHRTFGQAIPCSCWFSASQRFENIRRFLFAATAKAALPPTAPHPAARMRAPVDVPVDAAEVGGCDSVIQMCQKCDLSI